MCRMYDVLSEHHLNDVTFICLGMCGLCLWLHSALYPRHLSEKAVSYCCFSPRDKEPGAAACPGVFQRHAMAEVIRDTL